MRNLSDIVELKCYIQQLLVHWNSI